MLRQVAKVSIELLVPVGEGPEMSQVLDLIDVARAQAAAINLLQCDEVEVTKQITDTLQVTAASRMRQQMLPAAGQIMMVTLGADTHLNIETEQAQAAIARPFLGGNAMGVDPCVTQTHPPFGWPAPEHLRVIRARHLLRGALFGNQVVSHLQRLLRTARAADIEAILTSDDHYRYPGNLISHAQLLGLFHLALHAK